jgi:hypothetical protein
LTNANSSRPAEDSGCLLLRRCKIPSQSSPPKTMVPPVEELFIFFALHIYLLSIGSLELVTLATTKIRQKEIHYMKMVTLTLSPYAMS